MEAFHGVQIRQFTSWSYIKNPTLFSWSQMVEKLKSCFCVQESERKKACRCVCVCASALVKFGSIAFFPSMLDRWKAKKQYWPYMTISTSHFSLPSPSPSLFPPHCYLTCTLLNLISTVHILVFLTCCVDWLVLQAVCLKREICVWSLMKWVVLALVKNTERWVSLPRIQIGNFGDLRNAPTWNTHTHKHRKGMRQKMCVYFQLLSVHLFHKVHQYLNRDYISQYMTSILLLWILNKRVN